MKKVLITGGNGQLGYELQRTIPKAPKTPKTLRAPEGYTCISTDVADLDITNADAVKAYIADIKPDIIINSAAYTAVDKAEEEKELAIAINTTGAANLAQVCKDNDIRPYRRGQTMKAVYDPEKHHRRSIRLQEFDYAGQGAYSVTVCAWNKGCLFGEARRRDSNHRKGHNLAVPR